MWNKIRRYVTLLFLLFSITQGIAQSCWLSDLTTVWRGSDNITDFRNFIKSDPNSLEKFQEFHGIVGSTRILRNNNIVQIYARANPNVRGKLVNLTPRQIESFSDDFSGVSRSVFSRINNNPRFVDSWKVLDGAGANPSVRGSISEIQLVNTHYDEIVNYRGGYNAWRISNTDIRFFAQSGNELRRFLDNVVTLPNGKVYNGDVYRSLTVRSEIDRGALPTGMTDHHIFSSWGRYDLPGQENAVYLSKTLPGNQTELVPHYGAWVDFSTYRFSNVRITNMLDITDDAVRRQLGTQLDDLIRVIDDGTGDIDRLISYEMTNVIAKWARDNGYNGIIAPGARGTNNYQNVIIFEQSYLSQILQGITPTKIIK